MTEPAPIEARVAAVHASLIDKGLLEPDTVDAVAAIADEWKPENGAKVVAKSWVDPEYRSRLLRDGTPSSHVRKNGLSY